VHCYAPGTANKTRLSLTKAWHILETGILLDDLPTAINFT